MMAPDRSFLSTNSTFRFRWTFNYGSYGIIHFIAFTIQSKLQKKIPHCMMLVGWLGLNGPLRQYFSLYWAVHCMKYCMFLSGRYRVNVKRPDQESIYNYTSYECWGYIVFVLQSVRLSVLWHGDKFIFLTYISNILWWKLLVRELVHFKVFADYLKSSGCCCWPQF